MHELKIYEYACLGKSCHRCDEILPGFISDHGGSLLISPRSRKEHDETIRLMLDECPTQALSLDEFG